MAAANHAALFFELLCRIDQRNMRSTEDQLQVRAQPPDGLGNPHHRRKLRRGGRDADRHVPAAGQIVLQRSEIVFDAREIEEIDAMVSCFEACRDLQHAEADEHALIEQER